MIEIQGNLWDFLLKKPFVVVITTNGTIKRNGEAVMGKGCAREAAKILPQLPKLLGDVVTRFGNVVLNPFRETTDFSNFRLLTFPVKHRWYEKADMELIAKSAKRLGIAARESDFVFILPRPGCGNGGLKWKQVKPLLKDLPDNVLVISKPGE